MLASLLKTAQTGGLTAFYQDAKKHQNHFHAELPYRAFDRDVNVFENQHSYGVGWELSVLGGANDELIESLNTLVSDLPQGDKWDYQLSLFGHNRVGHYLEANEALLAKRGGISQKLARNEGRYAEFSAQHGFLHRGKQHFDLRDYHCFFFISTSGKEKQPLVDIQESVETTLNQLGFTTARLTPACLITHVSDILNFDRRQDRPTIKDYNPLEPIHQQILSADSELLTSRHHTSVRFSNAQGRDTHTRIVSMGLAKLPSDFRLYGLPECFASLRNVSKLVTCPHLFTLSFRQEAMGTVEHDNNAKISDLTKTVESKLSLIMPMAKEELEERKALQKGFGDKAFTQSSMVMGLTLFTHREAQRRDVQAAKDAFSSSGLDMLVQTMLQSQTLLCTLPFMMSEGLWEDCQVAGRVRTLKSSNLVNFFPIVLDHKRLSGGLLLPTMRGQISFFDVFNCGSDNKNIAITGGSGAGKSFFVQSIVKTVYAQGGKVWILDKGDSYKKLTLINGGVYLNHKNIFLNPFTHLDSLQQRARQGTEAMDDDGSHIDPMKEALSNITSLFATIVSPFTDLDNYQRNILGDAIMAAWEAHGTSTLVDHVQQALFELAKEYHHDQRITDLGVQLNKYCTTGIYGDTFNKPSMLDPNVDITTLELDGFNKEVLRSVIFALIVSINQQMYLSGSRSTPKMCVIEEAWSLLSGANAQAREFINEGYRTARKFGGSFATVTQGIEDFFANPEANACYDNSEIHATLRQGEGFDNFLTNNPTFFSSYEQQLIKSFPRAGKAGYSCVRLKAGGHVSYHRIFADPWTRACLSTEATEFEHCEKLTTQGMPLMEAIDATATHFYGDDIATYEQTLNATMEESDA